MQLCMGNQQSGGDAGHTFIASLLVACLKYMGEKQCSDLPYLVTGNTESLEKNHFDDVICNQRF